MSRRSSLDPADELPEFDPGTADEGAAGSNAVDLAALPIVGITRRRVAILAGAMFAAWIVVAFARQVGEASAATVRYEDIASSNAALRTEVAALERELELIGRQRYIEQQARGYGLGGPREIPFTLAKDAPPLPADAPGSAALRVGAREQRVTPLERWLTVLFGPSD
jgi:cell division protein FtsB